MIGIVIICWITGYMFMLGVFIGSEDSDEYNILCVAIALLAVWPLALGCEAKNFMDDILKKLTPKS